MKIFSLILLTFISFSASAAGTIPGQFVPTISLSTFALGNTFIWKHLEDGNLYSTEKYTVIESAPTKVVLEMATKIAGETVFKAHHRLEVNPTKCLEVYKNPAGRKPWSIRLYFWDKDRWSWIEGLNTTLAFEEKFNCDAFVYKHMYRTTVFQMFQTDLGEVELFQHRKHVNIEASWFLAVPEYAGVMAYKNMSHSYEKHQYTIHFSLTE